MAFMNTPASSSNGSGSVGVAAPRSGHHNQNDNMTTMTSKKDEDDQQRQQQTQRSRGRRTKSLSSSGPIPYLLMVLVAFSIISFIHSVNFLHEGDDHAIHSSLRDFKQGLRKTSPSSSTTIQKTKKETANSKKPPPNTANKNFNGDDDDPSYIDNQNDESPLANPPLLDGNSTFSSCLLVMDDNHRLVEWMAYHYHVLPLRFLIIAVDPRSKTSPTHVLNKWRTLGVYIEEWDDFKFMKHDIAKNVVPDDAELQIKRDRHRIRQKNFYRQCLQYSKSMNRTWVTLIDTDEFLTYNHMGGADFEKWEQIQQQRQDDSRFASEKRIQPSRAPPTTAEPGALIQYIWQEQAAGTNPDFFNKPCISCPRLQFGAQESTQKERDHNVPSSIGIKSDRLDTLRFRKHAHRQDFVKNGLSKSILDVSRITKFPKIQSLHRPIKTICSAPWKNEWDSGLRINHYLGSWEAYSFRDDSRRGGERSKEGWAFKAQDADETDDNIRPWIDGFVNEHGPDKSKHLLKGAGLPPGYMNPHQAASEHNWTIMFLDEILGMNETKGNDNRVAFDNFVRKFHANNQKSEGLQYKFHDQ